MSEQTIEDAREARKLLEKMWEGRAKVHLEKKHAEVVITALLEYEERHKPWVPPPDPPGVLEQFASLKEKWPNATMESREFINDKYKWIDHLVTIQNFPLPPGYNRPTCTVYFVVPHSYPYANPERFYTDELRMENGSSPYMSRGLTNRPSMGIVENMSWFPAPEGTMLWFWKVNSWNPRNDTLRTYVSVIKSRLDNVTAC